MSVTYTLVCDECKEKVWIGQSKTIYKYSYIADFFNDHEGHNLRYISDNSDAAFGVEDYYESAEAYNFIEPYYPEQFRIANLCGATSFLLGEDCLERPNLNLSGYAKNQFDYWYYTVFINAFLIERNKTK